MGPIKFDLHGFKKWRVSKVSKCIARKVVIYRGARAWLSLALFQIDVLVLLPAQCIAQSPRKTVSPTVLRMKFTPD